MGYTKLFSELVASSVWDEDDKTRIVWITMLALKDRWHFVRGTAHYLSLASRVSDVECAKALARLGAPDPKSRNTDNEGRRIREVPGGWEILSGEKYSKMLSYEERKEYNRNKQAEYRLRKKDLANAAKCEGAQGAIKDGLAKANQLPPGSVVLK